MNPFNDASSCVAVFAERSAAEAALHQLKAAGFDMEHVSVLGRDPHAATHPSGFHSARDHVKYWGKEGAVWGSILGLVFSPAIFWLPGIGPILTGGIISSVLMGTLEGLAVGAVAGGTGGLVAGALTSMGLPQEGADRFETALLDNKTLLVVHSTAAEVQRGYDILQKAGLGELHLHLR